MSILNPFAIATSTGSSLSMPTITLTVENWNDNTQTVTVPGILADESAQLIFPTPAIESQETFYESNIYCSGQAENSLTFKASVAPLTDLVIYVGILGV